MSPDDYDEPFNHVTLKDGVGYFFLGLFLLLCLGMCGLYLSGNAGDKEQATVILQEEGYTNIQITGGSVMGCGEGDWKKTTFRAKNQAGNTVSGVVCCGMLKGCTVRRL